MTDNSTGDRTGDRTADSTAHGSTGAGTVGAEDARALREHAQVLADAIDAALGPWVLRCVEQRCQDAGVAFDTETRTAALAAAERCRTEVGPRLRELLGRDIDDQDTTPLAVIRNAVRYPTAVLAMAGVPPVQRDDFSERSFPDDVYALTPASFAEIDPSLHEPGLVWGAAKAHVHLRRHRR